MEVGAAAVLAVLVAGLAADGCDAHATIGEGGSSSAPPRTQATHRLRDDAEVETVCRRLCGRTVACSTEMAHDMVKALGGIEAARRAAAEADQDAAAKLAECQQGCRSGRELAPDRSPIEEISRCLEQSNCSKFMTCMDELTPAP